MVMFILEIHLSQICSLLDIASFANFDWSIMLAVKCRKDQWNSAFSVFLLQNSPIRTQKVLGIIYGSI